LGDTAPPPLVVPLKLKAWVDQLSSDTMSPVTLPGVTALKLLHSCVGASRTWPAVASKFSSAPVLASTPACPETVISCPTEIEPIDSPGALLPSSLTSLPLPTPTGMSA